MQEFTEKDYRNVVDKVFKHLAHCFDAVDPDVVEYEYSQGAVSIVFSGGAKCILSTQPSVRQLWLAVVSKGLGLHFDYNSSQDSWFDDKGKNIELLSYLEDLVFESTGLQLKIKK